MLVTLPTNAPTTVAATATNTTTVNISWSASPGNSSITYVVMKSTTNLTGSFLLLLPQEPVRQLGLVP